jgi:L-lactate dehydrogenase
VARLVDVLLHDQRAILTVCCRIQGVPTLDGLTLALPHLVGGSGTRATIPLLLDSTEQQALARSVSVLRGAIASLQIG